jgi:hypothetical protein
MPKLITLEEHDAAVMQLQRDWTLDEPKPNGIACKCGAELMDTSPASLILLSNPPRKAVRCRKCGFKGSRLA